MRAKFILPALLITMSVEAFAAKRIKCPEASKAVPEGRTIDFYSDFFSRNKIVPVTAVTVNYVERFKTEFEKFPASLHRDLIKAGNKIHIMEGDGVTVDPSWESTDVYTFDGRPWKDVPGGGGSTARGYKKTPTRIVINHLYDKQGSVSLFLHEHGHSLDSIENLHGISNSPTWSEVYSSEPSVHEFLTAVCGSYCTDNVEEGFAELFANYHACSESREQVERELPRIAEFFKRFTSMKKLENIWDDTPEAQPEIATTSTPAPQSEKPKTCRRIFRVKICI